MSYRTEEDFHPSVGGRGSLRRDRAWGGVLLEDRNKGAGALNKSLATFHFQGLSKGIENPLLYTSE